MADNPGVTVRAIEAAQSVLAIVPPSFLGLVLLNLCFLGMTLWFMDSQIEARTALMGKIIEACIAHR